MSIQILVLMNHNEFHYEENLEAGHLKSYLSTRNVETTLNYINTDKETISYKIFDVNASLFAFALTETNNNSVFTAINLVKKIKPLSVVCVFDTFANYNWKNILQDNENIDFIPFGNSYKTVFDVYVKMQDGQNLKDIDIENLLTSENISNDKHFIKNDFSNYVWADRDNLKSRDVIIAHLISSYGCTSRCSFCTMPQIDNSLSFRAMEDVFDEILYIYKKYNIRFFHFNDATLESGGKFGKERLKKLCELLIAYPVNFGFRCFIRAASFQSIEDEKYLRLLKDAGFNNIFVGIESGSDDDLLVYNKNSTIQDNERFMILCKKNEINPFYGFVMIHPYSTIGSITDNYNFLIKHKSDQLSHYINCLQIYSNTPIFKRVQNDNLIYEDYSYKSHPFQYNCSEPLVNDIKDFLELNFYNDKELQKLNSSYHNFIFLKNYMKSICIEDENVELKSRLIADNIFDECREYFYPLYIKGDIETCSKSVDKIINNLKKIYISIQPLKEKLLKLDLKNQILSGAKIK